MARTKEHKSGRSKLTIIRRYAPDPERQVQALLIVLGYSVSDAVRIARQSNNGETSDCTDAATGQIRASNGTSPRSGETKKGSKR